MPAKEVESQFWVWGRREQLLLILKGVDTGNASSCHFRTTISVARVALDKQERVPTGCCATIPTGFVQPAACIAHLVIPSVECLPPQPLLEDPHLRPVHRWRADPQELEGQCKIFWHSDRYNHRPDCGC